MVRVRVRVRVRVMVRVPNPNPNPNPNTRRQLRQRLEDAGYGADRAPTEARGFDYHTGTGHAW